ncbi:hypothetical protein ACSYAD_28915 [Acaryochloris marina NIES-2412]|uniref:hypothetical protein n=1 Tax=Acaryochloris marina TaxID=155978 RepID=UPI004058E40E
MLKTFVVVGLLISFPTVVHAENKVLQFLNPCIQKLSTPRSPAEEFRVDAVYEAKNGVTYAYVTAIQQNGLTWDAVVSGNQSGCEINAMNPMGETVDITRSLPNDAAKGLDLAIKENQ